MGRLVRDDIMATVTQITTRYNQGMQNTISERTIRRTLQQMGSSSRRPHRVPLLSAKNRKRRLQFSWWWWCNGVIFWHTLGSLVPIEHCLNICSSLYDYSVPIFWCYFQQDNARHKAQIISDWFLVHDNEFTLLKWPPITTSKSNSAPLGCGGTGDSHHGCAADKSAATAWYYHVNMDQNLGGMFPTLCWIYATNN